MYAFDQSYRQVWKRSLGSPSPAEERQCGDINPLGITGTPVYDAATNHVFLVAEHGGSVRHELYALDAASGRVAWSKSVDLPGVSARDMQQRGALAIANNRVWVSYGAQAGASPSSPASPAVRRRKNRSPHQVPLLALRRRCRAR